MIEFQPDQVLALAIGVVLPLVVGIVTKSSTNSSVKAVLLLTFAAATNVLTELQNAIGDNVAFDLGQVLLSTFGTFLVGVGMQFGFWRPTGASAAAQSIGPAD